MVIFNKFHLINKLNFATLVKQTEMDRLGGYNTGDISLKEDFGWTIPEDKLYS